MFDVKEAEAKAKAGAPEYGIEITPEMIEAGVEIFCSYDSRFERPEECVVELYKAMNIHTASVKARKTG